MASTVCGFYTVDATRQYLPLVDVKVHTTILASTSRTKLTQTFVNSSATKLREVRYAFPLYEGVSVVAFTCRVGNRTIVGEVKEREKAKQDFKEAVATGQRAALFEQAREVSDCFATSVGNIPAGAKVEVDITYVGELKHDAEVDGIRFTIPAKILPRYGDYPVSLMPMNTANVDGKMDIIVDVVLPHQSSIQKIQSPSHPISVNLGTTSVAPHAEPILSKASASLGLASVGMEKDFILQVVAKDTGVPTAVLETHPTIPNQRALMTTLVPRFVLPADHPEIVFVVDRSGSMGGRPIELVKSALKVFLKSIPVGVKFNICSFGSSHSFLWNKSQSYSQSTLDQALKHVQAMQADFGGTEMYAPIQATISNRYKDLNLEILLLTDGEIWDQQVLFDFLNKQVTEAQTPLRVFTLGVGSGVSHALIEGIARAGHGFSQAVSDGEKMDSKLVRMLKGAMSPHVTDYTLEVKYASGSAMDLEQTPISRTTDDDDDDFELVERVEDCLKIDVSKAEEKVKPLKNPISLFDPSVDLDKADDKTGEGRFSHLPAVHAPKIMQTPHVIPPLYAFNRTTVYLLMSPECSHQKPKSVILRGKSRHGPLELEIPIQTLDGTGELVHQLAAKKAIAELEQGRGWLKYARDQQSGKLLSDVYESCIDDMVEREAVRLGVQFQVGGRWTSFVAVEKRHIKTSLAGETSKKQKKDRQAKSGGDKEKKEGEDKEDAARESEEEEDEYDDEQMVFDAGDADHPPAYDESTVHSGIFKAASNRGISAGSSFGSKLLGGRSGGGSSSSCSLKQSPPAPSARRAPGASPPPPSPAAAPAISFGAASPSPSPGSNFHANVGGVASSTRVSTSAERTYTDKITQSLGSPLTASVLQPDSWLVMKILQGALALRAATRSAAPRRPPLEALIELQTFEGFWEATDELAGVFGLTLDKIEQEAKVLGNNEDLRRIATALAISYFESKLQKDKDTWELVVDKAKSWLATQLGGESAVDELLAKVAGLLP